MLYEPFDNIYKAITLLIRMPEDLQELITESI